MVRFLHTADLQLGMPFKWAKKRAAELQRRREESISEIANVAGEHDVDFVVIAGDFFDANTVDDRVVVRACERLAEFSVPVYILPGNHDAGGTPDSVYRRDKFRRLCPEQVTVMSEPVAQPVADGEALLLAAPLRYRHSRQDPTDHLDADFGRDVAPEAIRIGLAHGGVTDFGESMNVIASDRAAQAELDYLALGDWHGCKEIDQRTWYSGAPEPTGFDEVNSGNLLIVAIDEPQALPDVEVVHVASTEWKKHAVLFDDHSDLEALEHWFDALERPLDTLVRLEIGGVLSLHDERHLEDRILKDAADRLLWLRRRGDGVTTRATAEELEALKSYGFVGAAVEQLQAKMGDEAEGLRAARALQLLHRIQSMIS